MKIFSRLFNTQTFLVIYIGVFLLLCLGVFATSGLTYFPLLFCFILSFMLFYVLGAKFILKQIRFNANYMGKIAVPEVLFFLIIGLFVGHIVSIGGFPAFECFSISKLSEAIELRKGITTRAHPLWNYISSISIKALIPFSIVLFWETKRKAFYWIILIIGCVYAFSLMQKSHILAVMFPILIVNIYERRWVQLIKNSILPVIVIITLVYITNPQMGGGIDDLHPKVENSIENSIKTEKKSECDLAITILRSLTRRVFIVPGEMVSEWFRFIPEEKPYLKGNGYNLYSSLNGSDYHDYSFELYSLIRPELAKKGIQGSVNVASFMREYSNFGILGLIISGFVTALFFLLLELLFSSSKMKIKLSLNLFLILLLSSGSLSTLMLSGGWFFMLILFFVFKNHLDGKKS